MGGEWYEVWADESTSPPYVLLVVPDEKTVDGVALVDPKEGGQVVYLAQNYEDARDWLLEDEYTQVTGRMRDEEPSFGDA